MKTIVKYVLKFAPVFVVAGLILGGTGWLLGGRGGVYLSGRGLRVDKHTRTNITDHNISAFTDISVDARYADIELIASDGYGIEISVSVRESQNPLCRVSGGKLTVTAREESVFSVEIIGDWDFEEKNFIRVYYPKGAAFESADLKTDTGDIAVSGADIRSLTVDSSYGDLSLRNIDAGSVRIDMSSGDITLADTKADFLGIKNAYGYVKANQLTAGRVEANLSSGDFTLTASALDFLDVKDSYGSVKATNLTSKGTLIDLSSGDVRLSGALSGENTIDSKYGKVVFETSLSERDYSFELATSFGNVRLNGQKQGEGVGGLQKYADSAQNTLNIHASSGDIEVNFG
jgi:DUF4097 and DUF4098 domain-containing protein YvlB